ncbi:unnamed protein product [Caenorhabditis angaria]|uniref:Uncharacterized protein n=1 Tax=Caenorhabditis angaria TaxID=860376 RepID=A0A9P1ILK8_9PELO|nr:unnamed protein product [Caenorhabditis angaria]
MCTAFRNFARIHGELHRKRQNYFEKRGLENAIQLNIDQQNAKIGQTIECLAVCEEITKKYNCSLTNSFQILIDEFAAKTFELTSLTSQVHLTCPNQTTVPQSREKSRKIAEIEWRIEREKSRIQILDGKIQEIFDKRK